MLRCGAKLSPALLGYKRKNRAPLSLQALANRDSPALCSRYTIRRISHGGDVMEPNNSPLDPVSTAALVVRLVDDIDSSDEERRDELLCSLLCAAWGSILAQNQ